MVGPPLWKIWVRQLGWWHSQYFWENNPNGNQTTNQTIFIEPRNWNRPRKSKRSLFASSHPSSALKTQHIQRKSCGCLDLPRNKRRVKWVVSVMANDMPQAIHTGFWCLKTPWNHQLPENGYIKHHWDNIRFPPTSGHVLESRWTNQCSNFLSSTRRVSIGWCATGCRGGQQFKWGMEPPVNLWLQTQIQDAAPKIWWLIRKNRHVLYWATMNCWYT